MQSRLGMIGEPLKEFLRQINVKAADVRTLEVSIEMQSWTSGKIYDDARQGLIKRHVGMTVSIDALSISQ